MAKKQARRIITPVGRLAFEYLLEMQPPIKDTGTPKYACKLILGRDADISEIKKLIVEALTDKYGSKENWPSDLKFPLKDNLKEKKDWNGFEDNYYITASSKFRPQLFGNITDPASKGPMSYYDETGVAKIPPVRGFGDRGQFYAGCHVKLQISAWLYDTTGNRGVALNLHAVQFIMDDEPLGGMGVNGPAPEGFDSEYDGADNPANYTSSAEEECDDIPF